MVKGECAHSGITEIQAHYTPTICTVQWWSIFDQKSQVPVFYRNSRQLSICDKCHCLH